MLLSYYIASINIEQVYHQVRAEQGVDEGYVEFPGMTLTDIFQLHEVDGTITEDFEGLAANNERAKAEKDSTITVIVMKHEYVDIETVQRFGRMCPYGLIFRGFYSHGLSGPLFHALWASSAWLQGKVAGGGCTQLSNARPVRVRQYRLG